MNKKIVKIIVPILIVAITIGIWVVKNNTAKEESNKLENIDFSLEATSLDLDRLKSYGLPIMIDFGADSCVPCKEMAPILKELNKEYEGKVIVKFVDIWKDKTLAKGFPLKIIPTQFFFDKEGNPYVPSDPESMQMILHLAKETDQHIYTAHQGGMTKEQILQVFKELGVDIK